MTREEAIWAMQFYKEKLYNGIFNQHIKAFDVAIAALREQQELATTCNRWISVEDRLPEEWKSTSGDFINYMVFMPEYGVDIGNYLQPANGWMCMGIPCEVTHWMPLPEPPSATR